MGSSFSLPIDSETFSATNLSLSICVQPNIIENGSNRTTFTANRHITLHSFVNNSPQKWLNNRSSTLAHTINLNIFFSNGTNFSASLHIKTKFSHSNK